MSLAEPVEESLFEMDATRIAEKGIRELPGTLGEAIDELERDDVIRDALGDHIFNHYLDAKRAEWDEYRTQVSDWEVDRYLDEFPTGVRLASRSLGPPQLVCPRRAGRWRVRVPRCMKRINRRQAWAESSGSSQFRAFDARNRRCVATSRRILHWLQAALPFSTVQRPLIPLMQRLPASLHRVTRITRLRPLVAYVDCRCRHSSKSHRRASNA